jgi:L,D-peptidoglycan transpeptidase YkuD (ErfK/YbiS/YcfS/YnhG family)
VCAVAPHSCAVAYSRQNPSQSNMSQLSAMSCKAPQCREQMNCSVCISSRNCTLQYTTSAAHLSDLLEGQAQTEQHDGKGRRQDSQRYAEDNGRLWYAGYHNRGAHDGQEGASTKRRWRERKAPTSLWYRSLIFCNTQYHRTRIMV